MTRQELANELAEREGLTVEKAKEILNTVFGIASEQLEQGEDVKIRGFGTLKVIERAERKFRNPKTRELSTLPSRKCPVFIPAPSLRDRVGGGAENE